MGYETTRPSAGEAPITKDDLAGGALAGGLNKFQSLQLVRTSEKGVLENSGIPVDEVQVSSYSGEITAKQSFGEAGITTFNFSSDNLGNHHNQGITEVGGTNKTTGYRVEKTGYYLVGCHLEVTDLDINTDYKAWIRAVVQFKKKGSTSWDSVQGYKLNFYANGDTVEVLVYRKLNEGDEVRFGLQQGGEGNYQIGTGNVGSGDVSRAFIAPCMVL